MIGTYRAYYFYFNLFIHIKIEIRKGRKERYPDYHVIVSFQVRYSLPRQLH